MLIRAGTVVTGHDVLTDGWVSVVGTTVGEVGTDAPVGIAGADHPVVDLGPEAVVVPGFIDMHVHGGGGRAFTDGPDAARTAIDLHRRHGTTSMMASLVSATPDDLLQQVRALAEPVHTGELIGIHLEGPWLSERRRGAHDPATLRDPEPAEVDRLLAAAGGTIRMVTLAPERAGGAAAVSRLVDAGVVVAVGHTDATYDCARAAIDAGATVGTHLFNAMRPVHHREPGPVIAMLEDDRMTVELIVDGVHLHPALYRDVSRTVGPDRVALVTDAMAAAGMPGGRYQLGRLEVDVHDGVATLAGGDTIAGSTATMDRVFRAAVEHSPLPRSEALLLAVRQTSINPARALGLSTAGITSGATADLVVLDDRLAVTGVLRRGAWLPRTAGEGCIDTAPRQDETSRD